MAQRTFSLFRSCRYRGLQVLQQRKTTMNPSSSTSSTHQTNTTITESNQSWRRSFSTSVAVLPDISLQADDVDSREIIIPFGDEVDVQIGTNYVRFFTNGNAAPEQDSNPPDPEPNFSFLIDADPKNIKILRPVAIRLGAPEDNNDVWIVHKEEDNEKKGKKKRWKDVTDIPLEDPEGVLQSPLYPIHLAQVLYATNSVEWKKGVRIKRKTLLHEEMPYATTSDELDAPLSVRHLRSFSKSQWNHCMNIQLAMLQNWGNARGRLALEAIMKKADYVCSDAAVDIYGTANSGNVTKNKELLKPTMVDNVGGGGCDASCVLSAAILKPGTLVGKAPGKTEILKMDQTWEYLDFIPRQYTPDFYFQSMSEQSAVSCITGDVKSDKLTAWGEQQIWNQSLIGLKDRNKTHAVYITPREAGILTLEREGNIIKTYKREYSFEIAGDKSSEVIDPNQIEKFFRDLVLTIWESAYSEASH